MSLLTLPIELLDKITDHVFADDLTSLMLSCRVIYRSLRDRLPEHATRQQNFTHFQMETSSETLGSPLRLLSTLIASPGTGEYFRTINFGILRTVIWQENQDPEEHITEEIQAQLRNVQCFLASAEGLLGRPLVTASNNFLNAVDDELDNGTLIKPINHFATVLCLALMPHLEEATMADTWRHLDRGTKYPMFPERRVFRTRRALWELFDAMVTTVGHSSESVGRSVPTKLRRIKFPPVGHSGSRRADMMDYKLFMQLKSVEELQISNIDIPVTWSDPELEPFEWRKEDSSSSLHVLEFDNCTDLFKNDLARILTRMPHLRTIRHKCIDADSHERWNMEGFVNTISQSIVGEKLAELSLRVSEGATTLRSITDGRCFDGLPRLEILEIDFDFLVQMDDPSKWKPGCDLESENQDELVWLSPRFVDLLPPSVKELKLHSKSPERDIELMIRHFMDVSGPTERIRENPETLAVTLFPNMPSISLMTEAERGVLFKPLRDMGVKIVLQEH